MLTGLFLSLAASATVETVVSPVGCSIAAKRMAGFVVLGQGMVENLEKRGVPPERKHLYEAMKQTLAMDEPLVARVVDRYEDVKATAADEEAFGSPNPQQMRTMLRACETAAR